MSEPATSLRRLSAEHVAAIAVMVGLDVAPERLPEVTTALAELFTFESTLESLDLTGIDASEDDVRWQERSS
jgi:Asp-tRNA(Asn)/Glu-tRNA(Gln) amidotransferase C subunit